MPIAPINDSGLQFYYEDSGPLHGSYITLVIVHGTAFTAAVFRRMLPFAASCHVRLVLLNRRDYPGSTPFGLDELNALSSVDTNTRRTALRKVGFEYGAFLSWFVHTQNTPPLVVREDGRREGGISLIAWSLAQSSAAPLVACPNELPSEVRSILTGHLRSYCTLDSPSSSFGLPLLTQYHPLTEEAVPVAERVPRFERWISTYYVHSKEALDRHDKALLDTSPMPYPTPPCVGDRLPTLTSMSAADKEAVSWTAPIASSELFLYTMPPDILYEHTQLALLDETAARALPHCDFILIWSTKGSWPSVSAAWDIERIYDEHLTNGQSGRKLRIIELPWANHFPHWDEPERTIQTLAAVC